MSGRVVVGDDDNALEAALPESPPLYPEDEISDRPLRFLAAELVREAAFEALSQELPYALAVEVVEFDEPNVIAWRHLGRHVWRYRLAEVEGGTRVTEEFDWRPSVVPWALRAMRAPQNNTKAMEATLDRLVDHFS